MSERVAAFAISRTTLMLLHSITSRIAQICAEIVHQNGHDCIVTMGARFGADLQFDETDTHYALLQCEELFCVALPDGEITTSSRVSDLVDLVAHALREKHGKVEVEWKDFTSNVW